MMPILLNKHSRTYRHLNRTYGNSCPLICYAGKSSAKGTEIPEPLEPTMQTDLLQPETLDELTADIQNNQESYRAIIDPDEENTPGDVLSKETANKILTDFGRKNNCTSKEAIVAITKLVQDGGTNASKTNLKRKINGITFDINDLRDTIKFHEKNGTVRKLAKTLRDNIGYISLVNGWPGPLLKDLMRNEPQLEIHPDEAIWCNEIHSDNYSPAVPPRIREALQRREQKIREQNKSVDKQKKKKGNNKTKKK